MSPQPLKRSQTSDEQVVDSIFHVINELPIEIAVGSLKEVIIILHRRNIEEVESLDKEMESARTRANLLLDNFPDILNTPTSIRHA